VQQTVEAAARDVSVGKGRSLARESGVPISDLGDGCAAGVVGGVGRACDTRHVGRGKRGDCKMLWTLGKNAGFSVVFFKRKKRGGRY
jgi:hypothetical protein